MPEDHKVNKLPHTLSETDKAAVPAVPAPKVRPEPIYPGKPDNKTKPAPFNAPTAPLPTTVLGPSVPIPGKGVMNTDPELPVPTVDGFKIPARPFVDPAEASRIAAEARSKRTNELNRHEQNVGPNQDFADNTYGVDHRAGDGLNAGRHNILPAVTVSATKAQEDELARLRAENEKLKAEKNK